jgi:hypothetical protein
MTIDSVYSFNILSRDIYLAIWIVLFTRWVFIHGQDQIQSRQRPAHRNFQAIHNRGIYVCGLSYPIVRRTARIICTASLLKVNLTCKDNIDQYRLIRAISASVFQVTLFNSLHDDIFMLTGYYDYEEGLKCAKNGEAGLLDLRHALPIA